eukprot:TRINITY_DN16152_c0_g1_i17.p1 TRINITY_DN16152_c0_g1~~TRINITY_DN16152_c0_g1_i17.p1  ORF type:complete len:140 (-),score=39.06 TRINITY_DN16152_c0_g1_i17:106-525(-)
MGTGCCESRYKENVLATDSSSFTSTDIKAIEELYQLAAFPPESTPRGFGFTYEEILETLTALVESMQTAGKLPQRILHDWDSVSSILSERAKENPEQRYTIDRDAFIQLWEIADEKRKSKAGISNDMCGTHRKEVVVSY